MRNVTISIAKSGNYDIFKPVYFTYRWAISLSCPYKQYGYYLNSYG